MSFSKLSLFLFFKMLCGALIIMFNVLGTAKATEQNAVRVKVLSFSQKAEEAAKRGDLEGVKEALGQVESLHNLPSMQEVIIGYSDVQEILGGTIKAVAEVYLKEAEEADRKGEEEKAKNTLKQAEQIMQQLPTFIKGPIILSKPVQGRLHILKQNIAAKAGMEALKQEENVKMRLVELEEGNKKEAERRKAQSATARPVEQTDQSRSWQEGQSLASSLRGSIAPSNPDIVPGYAGTNLPQSQIRAHDLGEEAMKASRGNEASQLISERFKKGERFVIDPHTDPIIVAGKEIVANPQKALDETLVETEEGGGAAEEIIKCEEGGEEYTQKCSKQLRIVLNITPKQTKVEKYCRGRESGHWFNFSAGCYDYCGACETRIVKVPKKVEVLREEWVDGCMDLEKLAEKGLCRYVSYFQSPKNETRLIEKQKFTRDHFEEHYQYTCLKTSTKSCSGLREKGCYQANSVCKEEIDGRCVLWEQTYKCPSYKMRGKSYRSSNKENPFCLSGDCADKSYAPNSDFANVMSHMSVLKEAGADLRNFGVIFKGQDRRCTRHCVDFKDCCGNGKGWGVSLSLASCDAEEKELAELRSKNRCIQVGTYCAEKVLGVCIRKKTSFCCYGTKLAKIVQEQGKRQLGLGFGDPEHPQCEGLTVEQLSRLDFSRIDFSELFAEIVGRTKSPNPEHLVSGIQKSMETKGSLLKPSPKGTGEGDLLDTSWESKQPSNNPLVPSPLPGDTAQTDNVQGNIQVQGHACQGRSHGQF